MYLYCAICTAEGSVVFTAYQVAPVLQCTHPTNTIRYDWLYWRAPKSWRVASLICRTEPKKRIMKKLKPKNGDAQKKRSDREVRGVDPEAGRESAVGKIFERGTSWGGSERKELWLVRVVSWQRRYGRSMNRQDRDRGAEMRLTERTRKLIPETG